MSPRRCFEGTALVLAILVLCRAASADPPAACGRKVTRASVVPCALAASLAARGERQSVEAMRGRERAASVVFPSNPMLEVMVAGRKAATQSAVNWYVTVSQEIEIGGQRGARLDAARAEVAAQSKRAAAAEREAAAAAWIAYFEAIAARDELALTSRLAAIAGALATSARARADQGLAAPVDADVAYAGSVRAIQARAAAERRAWAAAAALASAVGADPTEGAIAVEGDLVPLSVGEEDPARLADRAAEARADLHAAKAESAASERRIAALRRGRIPNLTLSATVQNDGFNERVFGGGIGLPIPLPWPVGRTNAGEIAEAAAIARRAETEVERLRKQVRLDVATAAQAMSSRRRELAAFDDKALARADEGLKSIGQELATGRLSVREALVAQQALVELLLAHVESKRALCIASVALARAAGVALERGAP